MSQPNPKIPDYTPSIKGRAPLPITNLPVNALTDATDPTQEIRVLIEQLQQSAREARSQLQSVADERDEFASKLEVARRQNEELRAHFVEITSLIRERDAALQEAERQARLVTDVQGRLAVAERNLQELRRQCDDANRQRDEAARAREELNRRIDSLTLSSQETNRRFNDAQKQLFSIRQARDGALAQCRELSEKVERAEDKIADLEYQIEKLSERGARVDGIAEQLAAAQKERDEAIERWNSVTAEFEQSRAKLLEFAEQKASALESGSAYAVALAEAREQINQLMQDREATRLQVEVLTQRLATVSQQQGQASSEELEAARKEIAALQHERDTGEVRLQVLSREIIDLRNQLQGTGEQAASTQRQMEEIRAQAAAVQAQLDLLARERDHAQRARDEALASVANAQKQIDRLLRERDLARQEKSEDMITLEAQVEALRAELSAYEAANPTAAGGSGGEIRKLSQMLENREYERRELAARLDEQRLESIDLAAQLQAAHEQIKTLSANLAEARLSSKRSGARLESLSQPAAAAQVIEVVESPFAGFDVQASLRAMRRCYQAFTGNPEEMGPLQELHGEIRVIAERATAENLVGLERLASTFAQLVDELFHYPEQINPSTLRTVNQTIEFIATLLKLKNLRQLKDPSAITIYAVDDDVNTCECIRIAMEGAELKTLSAQEPAKALCELAELSCDLIVLDINMPGMDGFELCAEIRRLARHTTTPVVFLTGFSTSENRLQSSLSGGNDFMSKPFILCELTTKALVLIFKAQLHLA